MNQLVRFDTNTLNKALIGFDRFFDTFEQRFANQINTSYPPYNILKPDANTYKIEVAVTGFEKDDLTVEIDQYDLIVKGTRKQVEMNEPEYVHRGLATRDFTRVWQLGEHMEVGEVVIKNGVLTITVNRIVPEALKPRVLKITEA